MRYTRYKGKRVAVWTDREVAQKIEQRFPDINIRREDGRYDWTKVSKLAVDLLGLKWMWGRGVWYKEA